LQEELGQYDYGARFYDPVVARFTSIDPYSEFFPWMTNYQYGSNNPSSKIDIDGLEGVFSFEEAGVNFEPIQNIAKAGGELEGEAVSESSASQSSSIKIEWHHLIPQALKGLEMIKQAIKEGFGFDEEENLSPQEKFSKSTGKGTHGNHPKYTEAIKGQLEEAAKSNPGSSAADIVRKVAANARQTINNNPFTKMNDLYGLNLLIIQPLKPVPAGHITVGPVTITPLPAPKPKPKPAPTPAPENILWL
jgi:RHS repeat-associated protein